jgi:hypothetical protein
LDEEYAQITFWRDLMVIHQTEAVHGHVENFLGALRRAAGV